MKKHLLAIWHNIDGIKGLLLIIYLSASLFFSSVSGDFGISLRDGQKEIFNVVIEILRNLFFSFAVSAVIYCLLLKLYRKYEFKIISFANHSEKERLTYIFYIIPFIVFLIYYLTFYPGGFSPDSFNQYKQAVTDSFNDWHPAIHTLIFFKLPLTLTNGWTGSIILFQIISFSISIGYATNVIYKFTNKRLAVAFMLFVLINPQTGGIAVLPWKDAAFAIFSLLSVSMAFNSVFTKGEWLKKAPNVIAFIIVITLTTMFRHNAILFTVPLLIALFFSCSKKKMIFIIISVAVLIFGIGNPLYNALGVEKNRQSTIEYVGLPMNIIGAVVAKDSESLDKETKEFAYSVAPKEIWENNYKYGSFNYIKWTGEVNEAAIEEYGAVNVLKAAAKCFVKSPFISFVAFAKLTENVYSVYGEYNSFIKPAVVGNEFGIKMKGVPVLRAFYLSYLVFCNIIFPHLFMYIGFMEFLLIFIILVRLKWLSFKRVFFVLPVFVYNFGTMLLLTGEDDTARFFYYTFLVTPILLLSLLKEDKKEVQ